jgi:hypothetical protein
MREAGYVPVRTRKLTGKQASYWLYRVTGDDKGVCTAEPAPRKASAPVVQTMTKPHPWFKRVALDGKWQHVYADHIRFLTKKRHRVDGTCAGLYRWRAYRRGDRMMYANVNANDSAKPKRYKPETGGLFPKWLMLWNGLLPLTTAPHAGLSRPVRARIFCTSMHTREEGFSDITTRGKSFYWREF